jgi:type IV pilus assembly protein PilA
MSHRFLQLRPARSEDERGFTLIELLVVVVIIGILIAIAIPVYLSYQKGAADKSAQSDVHNAIGVLELCNSDNGSYPTSIGAATNTTTSPVYASLAGCTGQKIPVTKNTTLVYTPVASTSSYTLTGSNSGGKPTTYCYNSLNGGGVVAGSTC